MFGKNPIRPPSKGDGEILDVTHIFPTIQGEGPFAGIPSVFVRLGGCNLACAFCDTEFETFEPMPLAAIIERVASLAIANDYPQHTGLVVITGGEPLRQPIAPLCDALLAAGYRVQVETNGTLYRSLPAGVQIICSPKNSTGKGYAPVRDDLLQRVNALKFVVSAHMPGYTDIADVGQSRYGIPVYVQPMDEYDVARNADNIRHASQLAATGGYKLSMQAHKIIDIE
jgi:7-carboxy-7-deazaguanine synthase